VMRLQSNILSFQYFFLYKKDVILKFVFEAFDLF